RRTYRHRYLSGTSVCDDLGVPADVRDLDAADAGRRLMHPVRHRHDHLLPAEAGMEISFLASHGGSSARALIAAMTAGELAAEPGILVTNNRDSAIFHWCRDHDMPVRHISAKTHRGEDEVDEALAGVLREAGTDLVVFSGYMKRIGP